MELDELYQDIILDHYKHPQNFGVLANADCSLEGKNPFCGDEITVYLTVKDNRIESVMFQGNGCAISQASASIMTGALKGKTIEQAQIIIAKFAEMVKEEGENFDDSLEELNALQGVSGFPTRIKCALLAWNTFKKALEQYNNKETS